MAESKIIEEIKDLLSDPKNKIKLNDYVTEHIKTFLTETDLNHFPVQGLNPQKENFLDRMQKYEEAVKNLQYIVILLARWGEDEQISILSNLFNRIAEADKGSSGTILWLNFGWYPIGFLPGRGPVCWPSCGRFSRGWGPGDIFGRFWG